MTLQATTGHLPKAELHESVFVTGILGRKAEFCGQSRRAPFKQLTVASSRNPGHPRAPLWKGRLLSNEALRAVQELKRAKAKGDDARLCSVLKSRVARLLKFDLIAVFNELQRQNECDLALKIFDIVQKEFWYKPDEELFYNLVATMGRNNRIEDVERLYALATSEGVLPGVGFYTEIMSARLGAGNIMKAIEVYRELRNAGFPANPAFGILRKALVKNGDIELVDTLVKEYGDACRNSTEIDGEVKEEAADIPNGDVELTDVLVN